MKKNRKYRFRRHYKSGMLSEGIRLCLKHWKYIPTAIRTLSVVNRENMVSWSNRDNLKMRYEYPFASKKEKDELLRRATWLCNEVIVNKPEELIAKMPDVIGRLYQGEWAIYACSMTACALCNLIRLYPELKDDYIEKVAQLIELTNTPVIRFYDTMWWQEDAMETLEGEKSHMTYLSILAWMIGNYRLAGGDGRYNALHKKLCDTLNRRMLASRDLNLPSFPNGVIFLPDMMFAALALKDYDSVYGETYQATITEWLYNLKTRYLEPKTGLLSSTIFRNMTKGRTSGAYSGLNTTGLALLDKQFGEEQLQKLKDNLIIAFGKYAAVKEYLKRSPKLTFDIDAGPVIYGLSPSGTAFAIGAATYLGDWELRQRLLNTAFLAGGNVRGKKCQHYRLAEIMLTGEAITLAMRTMVNFNSPDNASGAKKYNQYKYHNNNGPIQ